MHIAIINTFYYPAKIGGAERSVQILAESLVERGHRVSVLCTSLDGTSHDDELNGVQVFYRPQPNVYNWTGPATRPGRSYLKPFWHAFDSWNPLSFRRTAQYLSELRPDIVHTNNVSGFSVSTWSAARRLRIPLLHTIRDYYLMCFNTMRWKNDRVCVKSCASCAVLSWPKRQTSGLPQAVVGISQDVLERHLQAGYFAGTPIQRVIGNSVQTVASRPERTDEEQGPLRVVFLGRLEASKGVELLWREFSQLPPHEYRLRLYGRGDATYLKRLQTLYPASNIEVCEHERPEVIFSEADVTVVPSLWDEPFGRVVAESYSYGLPVIASARGGLGELVQPGATGDLFDPGHAGELASRLARLTRQSCRAFRSRCLQEAERFSASAIATGYERLYGELLGSGGNGGGDWS